MTGVDDQPGRVLTPWTLVNGRRITVPTDCVPDHMSPCNDCGRLMDGCGPDDVCGACFGSVCDA